MMTDDVITVEDAWKSFGSRSAKRTALAGVSFTVPTGQVCGVLGPNGAGKTTLVRILSTMLRAERGDVHVCGWDVRTHTARVRERIGVVLGGDRGLYPRLTGAENLEYWGSLYRLRRRVARARSSELLALVGLSDDGGRRVSEYSRGMKQRLHLARGMIGDPQVLFLDEPTIGLDPVGVRTLRQIIRRLATRDISILLTTHDMDEAEELCGQILLVNEGRIVLRGAPGALQLPSLARISVEVGGLAESVCAELARLPGVLSYEFTDSGARFGLDNRQYVADIVAAAHRAGAERVVSQPASVEDAYFALFDTENAR
jgi:ABC-2 type transport system ATP-binding protein